MNIYPYTSFYEKHQKRKIEKKITFRCEMYKSIKKIIIFLTSWSERVRRAEISDFEFYLRISLN